MSSTSIFDPSSELAALRQETGQDPPPFEVVTRKRQELEIGLGIATVDMMGRYLFAFHLGPPSAREREILESMIPTMHQLEQEANAAIQNNARSNDEEFSEQVFFRGHSLDPVIASTQAQRHRETIRLILERQRGAEQEPSASSPETQFDALCEDLRSGEPQRIKAAIDALTRLGDPRALPYLEPFLESDDLEIYRPAARAISSLERK